MRFEDFVQATNLAPSVESLTKTFLRFVAAYGVQRFMLADLSQPSTEQKESRLTLMVNYPQEWLDRYLEQHYVEADPVYLHALRVLPPFRWSDLKLERRSLGQRVMDEAGEFGLRSGIGICLPQPRGRLIGIGLSSAEPALRSDADSLSVLSAATHQLVAAYSAMVMPQVPLPPTLSPREREVLLWIAAGRSKADVAHFLRFSEAGVKRHCENIARKLGTATLAASVAQAIRRGLIDPF